MAGAALEWYLTAMRVNLALLAIALLVPSILDAEPGSTPPLPAAESFVYARTVGNKKDQVEVRTRLVSNAGESWYEITSHSEEQDSVFRLDAATLLARYVEVTSRSKDSTLRRVTEVLEVRTAAGPDEFLVSGFDSLPYSLRAFPWGLRQKAKLRFMGSGASGDFSFELNVSGKETIEVVGTGVECWKAQLSLGGIFGAMFGKSYLWYSTAYPHYLVKSESASGGPGSPTAVLRLQKFSEGPALE